MLAVIKRLLTLARALLESLEDIWQFCKYSTTCRTPYDQKTYIGRIIAHTHVIEKGLAMPEVHVGFGRNIVAELVRLLNEYKQRGFDLTDNQIIAASGVLCIYYKRYFGKIKNLQSYLPEQVFLDLSTKEKKGIGGYKLFTRKAYFESQKAAFDLFSTSRCSVRDYCDEPISDDLIRSAIELAQKTPSSCNRQPVRVCIVKDHHRRAAILSLQTGNRGFGHLSERLLVVSVCQKVYHGISERNLAFIDGGMFCLGLTYSLHFFGIASCILNWATTHAKDRRLRILLNVPAEETVVAILSIGYPSNSFKVPISDRRAVDAIIREL